jgi:hypothetical protein
VAELWFFLGLAFGMVLTGFCTIGSFDRGVDSVRIHAWKLELAARQRAVRRAPSEVLAQVSL